VARLMVNVPLELLISWRSPDREIHRALTVHGPQTVPELRRRLGGTSGSLYAAMNRMSKLAVVSPKHGPREGQRAVCRWSAQSATRTAAKWNGRHVTSGAVR